MVDLWRDLWIRETGTGQQVTQLHDRYMTIMMMMMTWFLLRIRETGTGQQVTQHHDRYMMMMMMMMMMMTCIRLLLLLLWGYASVVGLWLAGINGSNPYGGMDVCRECCVLSGRGLCDGLITRPEESYRLWRVVCDLGTWSLRGPGPARAVEPW